MYAGSANQVAIAVGATQDREQRQVRQPVLKSPLHVNKESSARRARRRLLNISGTGSPGLSAGAPKNTDNACRPSRRSVRWFARLVVSINVIEPSVRIAPCAPSVCFAAPAPAIGPTIWTWPGTPVASLPSDS